MRGMGAMEAQLQIRQNATEMQAYIKDLFEWEQGMKKADKKMSGTAAGLNHDLGADSGAPAPRGRAAGKVGAAPLDMQKPGLPIPGGGANPSRTSTAPAKSTKSELDADNKLKGTAAAHTYSSYSKWDKLNLDDSDEEDAASHRRHEVATRSPVPAHKPAAVLSTSQPGSSNNRFGQAAAAVVAAPRVEASETGMPPIRNAEPQTAEEWRLRGNALFKVGQYASAKECYSRSILVEPSCLSYANRAMVEIKLSNWEAAEQDCTEALNLDPSYAKGHHRRGTARRHLGKHLEAAEDFDTALRCEPHSRAIQSERDSELRAYMLSQKLQSLSKRSKLTNVSVSVLAGNGLAAEQRPSKAPHRAPELTGAQPASSTSRVASGTAAVVAVAVPTRIIQRVSVQPRAAPKTSMEFENAWRSMAGDVSLQAAYLKLIEPATLPAIFKTSLTGAVLASVVKAVLTGITSSAASSATVETERGATSTPYAAADGDPTALLSPQLGASILSCLSNVPRFDMTAMCLTGKDKTELKGLWDAASKTTSSMQAEFDALRKKFRL